MPDWLSGVNSSPGEFGMSEMVFRVALALVWGLGVAWFYRLSHGRVNWGREKYQSDSLPATLVLLSGLIAMVSMVIGGNVARAFSLVGALSIVRFRTVVEDTRDTAFVIFSVVVGMATGSGYLWLPAAAIPIIGGVAVVLDNLGRNAASAGIHNGQLRFRAGLDFQPETVVEPILGRHCSSYSFSEVETARQGTILEFVFQVSFAGKHKVMPLVRELNASGVVQGVEFKVQNGRG